MIGIYLVILYVHDESTLEECKVKVIVLSLMISTEYKIKTLQFEHIGNTCHYLKGLLILIPIWCACLQRSRMGIFTSSPFGNGNEVLFLLVIENTELVVLAVVTVL